MEDKGWNYFVLDWAEQKVYAVYGSLEEARGVGKPGQEIWRAPLSGGIAEFIEEITESN